MKRTLTQLGVVVAAAVALAACAADDDRCRGFTCAKDRICIELASGPICVCSEGTTADDAGVCIETDPADDVDAGDADAGP